MKTRIKTYLLLDFDTIGMKSMALKTDNPSELLDILWEIIIENEYPYQWRAAWFFEQTIYNHPEFANLFLDKILDFMPKYNHPGQLRHSLKVILLTDVSLWDFGIMLKLGYDLMLSENQPPAIRVYALEIVFKIVLYEPDLKREFIDSLHLINDGSSKGIKSRVRRTLDKLVRQ